MNRCYVCLEACETKSPCECQMPVHEECLATTHQKMPRTDCSICRSPIQVEYVQLRPEPPMVYLLEMREHTSVLCCAMVYIFSLYLLFGWAGKLFLFVCGYQIDAFPFWTLEHMACFIGVLLFVVCASNSVTVCRR